MYTALNIHGVNVFHYIARIQWMLIKFWFEMYAVFIIIKLYI
jgi:hypothetical protein